MLKNRIVGVIALNCSGFLVLLLAHYASDRYHIGTREGINQTSPYFFLLLFYGWIVFHNKVLFERMFLAGRKRAYFGWTSVAMTLATINMAVILTAMFRVRDPLPQLLNFWVYTIAGLGVFLLYKSFVRRTDLPGRAELKAQNMTHVTFNVEGVNREFSVASVMYVETLENYLKIFCTDAQYIVRNTMKDAEARLPKDVFIRISRSHLVNKVFVTTRDPETVYLGDKPFKIGKVYKRYVEEQLPNA